MAKEKAKKETAEKDSVQDKSSKETAASEPAQNTGGADTAATEPAAAGADAANAPQFALQRIYLKDSSFESPRSPEVFQGQWQPKINFDIKTRGTKVRDDIFEVVLTLTVEAKLEEEVAFLAEVHQAGIFTLNGFDDVQLEQMIFVVCPNILFPYGREAIDALVVKGSFPAMMLSPINFDALYHQKKQQEAEQAAQGTAQEVPAPDSVQ